MKYKLYKRETHGLPLIDTRILGVNRLKNARDQQRRNRRKGLKMIGMGRKFKFYLDGLDQVFEVEPIVIEELNHAINLGLEF